MSLVAYGSDSDSETSDVEESQAPPVNIIPKPLPSKDIDDNISDEEDAQVSGGNREEDFFDIPAEPDLLSLISEKLPHTKLKSAQQTFIDEAEDTSAIPEKKDYGDKPEEPPAKKKKRQGPVQIVLPALAKLDEEDEPRPGEKEKKQASKTGSGLFSLLPAPKNSFSRKPSSSVMEAASTAKTSALLAANPSENNLKPQGVRKVGLVPHRVANPVKPQAKKDNSDSDDDDGDYLNVNSSSYFPAPSSVPRTGSTSMMTVNPVPGGSSSHNIYKYERVPSSGPAQGPAPPVHINEEMLGPAVAPYPPPAPAYPDAGKFVESEEAIMRLAGKQNKLREMKEENVKIVDVNEEDMRGDPRVWLTKAMTEEKAPRPTGKGPKGLARSRHQITYLAHQAKERDWELRQEWATARENKRASANKYGF